MLLIFIISSVNRSYLLSFLLENNCDRGFAFLKLVHYLKVIFDVMVNLLVTTCHFDCLYTCI